MILGMSLGAFTLLHVLISVVGLASGFVVLFGLLSGHRSDVWNAVFLSTTVLTSLTGYLFPVNHLMPSHIVGFISLLVLAVAIAARYIRHLRGAWERTYAICACFALYLNTFVAVVQAFEKAPALKSLAPTQSEPPFLAAQFVVLAAFVAAGVVATRRSSHPIASAA